MLRDNMCLSLGNQLSAAFVAVKKLRIRIAVFAWCRVLPQVHTDADCIKRKLLNRSDVRITDKPHKLSFLKML